MNVFFPSNNALANAMYANGNRISELAGHAPLLRGRSGSQQVACGVPTGRPTDALSFQGGVDYNKDHYPDTTYGLQDSTTGPSTPTATTRSATV